MGSVALTCLLLGIGPTSGSHLWHSLTAGWPRPVPWYSQAGLSLAAADPHSPRPSPPPQIGPEITNISLY